MNRRGQGTEAAAGHIQGINVTELLHSEYFFARKYDKAISLGCICGYCYYFWPTHLKNTPDCSKREGTKRLILKRENRQRLCKSSYEIRYSLESVWHVNVMRIFLSSLVSQFVKAACWVKEGSVMNHQLNTRCSDRHTDTWVKEDRQEWKPKEALEDTTTEDKVVGGNIYSGCMSELVKVTESLGERL